MCMSDWSSDVCSSDLSAATTSAVVRRDTSTRCLLRTSPMPTVLSPDAVPGPESAGNGPEGPGQSTDPRRGHPTGDLAERDPSTTRTGSRVAEHDLVAVLQGDPLLVAEIGRASCRDRVCQAG